ncbi:MAG: glycoside hydrolase family 3 protein [Deltaproteobacteria bacterium]|nr:glycoside hydrolase family 3 protein [Deltaproteobacteria bacterium]
MNQRKEFVMHASPKVLQLLGRHTIVGYHDLEELKTLVQKGAVGWVFISQRNLRGKTFEQMQLEIESLQEIQKQAGRDPLFIATDQEGGLVSKLSPLLTHLPPLSQVLEDRPSTEQLAFRVKDYASTQAKELFDLGINVNFAPVVDLKNEHPKDFIDTHSLLDLRSISSNPQEVSQVTKYYLEAYNEFGVIPTLKHFPGMGRIQQDTHFKSGILNLSKQELQEKDWLPFKENLSPSKAWIMMGHTQITAIDAHELADLSPKVIQGLIRGEWQHEGVLISDDFSMGPVYSRNGGVGVAAVDALNAGLDMILISYDPDLYYEVMHGLIKAFEQNQLHTAQLGKSEERLNQSRKYLTRHFLSLR